MKTFSHMFQENKSFGAITICIHPLMYIHTRSRVGNNMHKHIILALIMLPQEDHRRVKKTIDLINTNYQLNVKNIDEIDGH